MARRLPPGAPALAHPPTAERPVSPRPESDDESPQLASALKRLAGIAALNPSAHPYGAEAIPERAVRSAKKLLSRAAVRHREAGRSDATFTPYFIGPVPDGGVQLKWRSVHAQLWLICHPSGGYGYLFERLQQPGRFEEGDDISLQDALQLMGNALAPHT